MIEVFDIISDFYGSWSRAFVVWSSGGSVSISGACCKILDLFRQLFPEGNFPRDGVSEFRKFLVERFASEGEGFVDSEAWAAIEIDIGKLRGGGCLGDEIIDEGTVYIPML